MDRDNKGRFIKGCSPSYKNGRWMICNVCGKSFYVSESIFKRTTKRKNDIRFWERKYCSNKCWLVIHKQGFYRNCLVCNNKFYVKKYRENISKFCSQTCSNKYYGKSHRGKNHPRWTGLTPIYQLIRNNDLSVEWRNNVFHRDNYTCKNCGCNKSGSFNAHHIKSFNSILREFLNIYNQFSPIEDKETLLRLAEKYEPFWDINNGITFCKKCHQNIMEESKCLEN